jgi:spore coat polysaccharide biosynthesis predicted glycosyltransferase SpsG
MTKRIGIYCEGGQAIGYGHIRRSMTLLHRLQAESITAGIHGLSSEAERLIGIKSSKEVNYEVVVFDSPLEICGLLRKSRLQGKKIITLDYFGYEEPDVNIVIFEHYPIVGKEKYVGFEFQMIRRQITELTPSNYGEGVLVAIGGGDILRQGDEAAALVERIGEHATLVKGPLCCQATAQGGYEIVIQPIDFEKRLQESRWLVTNGGGCMFEAMYLAKPVVVLPQTKEENRIAQEFLHRGAILGIGLESIRRYKEEHLRETGRNAKNCIDGQGVERIFEIIWRQL